MFKHFINFHFDREMANIPLLLYGRKINKSQEYNRIHRLYSYKFPCYLTRVGNLSDKTRLLTGIKCGNQRNYEDT